MKMNIRTRSARTLKSAVSAVSAVGGVMSLASLTGLALVSCTGSDTNAPSPELASSPARISAYTSPAAGFDTKNFFVDTGREVVVVDAQFTEGLAEQSIAFIQARTKSPITHVVVTHPNPDKFGGLAAFRKRGVKIVASEATARAMPGVHAYKKAFFVDVAKMFTAETFPVLVKPDVTFRDALTLKLAGGTTLELTELNSPGVSSNQTVVFAPQEKALFVGDLVHENAHAWLEGGIVDGAPTPTLESWKKVLVTLAQRYPADTVVFGGRGDSAPLASAVAHQTQYLTQADALVGGYVDGLGDRKTELSNAESGAHFAAITKQFEAAFPGRALSYMIQYGVYGLAQSKARK